MVDKIVIVGFGRVGQANALALGTLGLQVYYHDPQQPRRYYSSSHASLYDRIASLPDPRAEDGPETRYVVCVGDKVAADGKQDIADVALALDGLRGVRGQVILRSTILPGLLAPLPFDLYLPEFLHEKRAVEDARNPTWVVVGKQSDRAIPQFLQSWLQQAKKAFVGTPAEAAHIKYLSNIWNATRVAFVNEFGFSIASPAGADGLSRINRIVDFVMEEKPYLRFGRAFEGRCLPKDTRAYLRWAQDLGHSMELLSGISAANLRHSERAGHALLPEWFAEQ